jgi:multidrug efflux pump subunit AcrA (membrane-fusion protein)
LAIERNRALSEIDVIQTTLNSLELRTKVPGLVLYRRDRRQDPQIGDECQPGQVLVELVNLEVLQARIYVLERDGGNLAKGMPVVIKLDAIPEKEFHGTLRSVATVSAALVRNSPLRYFYCDVAITDAGRDLKRIRPGMSLKGDVVLQKYDSCFVVPSSAVTYRERERDSLVFVQKGNSFVAQKVQTGLSAHGEAVIVSGVEEGNLIALRNPNETRKLSLPDFSKGSAAQQGRGGMPGMPPGGMMMMMRGGR